MAFFTWVVLIISVLSSFAQTQLNTLIPFIALEPDKYTVYFIDMQTKNSSCNAFEIDLNVECKHVILNTTHQPTSMVMPISSFA